MQDRTRTPGASPARDEGLSPRPGEVSLSAALEVANIGTWEYDVESRCFLFNDQYYRLHGLTAAQAGGYRMHASEFASKWVHPEDACTVAQRIQEAVDAQDPSFQSRTEGRILRADGQPLWITIWFRIEKDAQGRTVRLHGVNQDIHQRKLAETELRHRAALERVVTGISTRQVGCTPEEVDAGIDEALAAIGEFAGVDRTYVFLFRDPPSLMDNTHEWCAEGVSSEMASLQGLPVEGFPPVQVVREGRAYHVPRVVDLPEGCTERREFEREAIQSLIAVPVQSAGRVLGFLGLDSVRSERTWSEDDIAMLRVVGEILANVIERQRALAAVAERERRLRFITDSMLDIVSQVGPDGRVEYVSPSVTRLLGYMPDDIVNRHGLELVHPEDADPLLASVRAASEAGASSCRVEYRYRHIDGRYVWFESAVRIVKDGAGALAGTVFTSRDISERKQIEEQLREAQKLESVGRLAAGVAHDFNNLLTPIMGYSDLLRYQLRDLPESRGLVEEIARAAERSRDLVHQLLAFSRKQLLDLQPVDLGQVVSGVERLLRRTLRESIEFSIAASPEPCQVRADVGQLEQVIMNLAVNAQDAMPDGGSLRIRTAVVDLDASFCATHAELRPGRHALLSVADSGHGMDAETRSHVFEPFFTTREVGKGIGLGLATVYGIVKQHGGAIVLESEPGSGATFDVYLPALPAGPAESRKEAARQGLRYRRNETVMVVEDDDMVRELVVRVLEHLGCTVLAARTGEACLELLARHEGPLHLLLTDVVVPGLSGRELSERVARTFPAVKVVFMSGYTRDLVTRHGIPDDGFSFLQKPFSVATLVAKLGEVLDPAAG